MRDSVLKADERQVPPFVVVEDLNACSPRDTEVVTVRSEPVQPRQLLSQGDVLAEWHAVQFVVAGSDPFCGSTRTAEL